MVLQIDWLLITLRREFRKEKSTHRISELGELADEVPPAQVGHPQGGRIVGVVDGLALVAVVE